MNFRLITFCRLQKPHLGCQELESTTSSLYFSGNSPHEQPPTHPRQMYALGWPWRRSGAWISKQKNTLFAKKITLNFPQLEHKLCRLPSTLLTDHGHEWDLLFFSFFFFFALIEKNSDKNKSDMKHFTLVQKISAVIKVEANAISRFPEKYQLTVTK